MAPESGERIAPDLGDPLDLRAPPRQGAEKTPWTLARKLKWLALGLPLGMVLLSVLSVVILRWLPPPTTAFMLHQRVADWRADRPAPPFSYQWVPWSRISASAKLAAIAAEDQKFPEHHGFDVDAISKALAHNRSHRRVRGASTISQQVAKNLFLWPERSWLRKGLEVYFTLLIEVCWPKQRILEVYLNIAEFGHNTYGVEAAARRYWQKPAARLSSREAALLAAVLPSPRRLRAQAPSAYVQSRASWIEGQMRQLGPVTLGALQGS